MRIPLHIVNPIAFALQFGMRQHTVMRQTNVNTTDQVDQGR